MLIEAYIRIGDEFRSNRGAGSVIALAAYTVQAAVPFVRRPHDHKASITEPRDGCLQLGTARGRIGVELTSNSITSSVIALTMDAPGASAV